MRDVLTRVQASFQISPRSNGCETLSENEDRYSGEKL